MKVFKLLSFATYLEILLTLNEFELASTEIEIGPTAATAANSSFSLPGGSLITPDIDVPEASLS